MSKTLANCKPTEFVAQTVRIKDSVEKWLNVTKLSECRVEPKYKTLPEDAPAEERVDVIRQNAKAKADAGLKSLSNMMDACLKEHPQETLEVLALCCFVEPSDVDEHPMNFYMQSINELMNDRAVLDFFTSLAMLAQITGSSA